MFLMAIEIERLNGELASAYGRGALEST